ncbi:DUF6351 family protein [Nocardioides perillae]|uniref:DUF6351 domain-containing protein n=1 Tax=Nocardioides perillae TaxID=1119534 RepID=A0A7Y9RUA7_9ACTN|nr:DUF6351 family protein [Nocardioides perillae]NYG54110.1 hypothetical protein [Nocardioides perillae]
MRSRLAPALALLAPVVLLLPLVAAPTAVGDPLLPPPTPAAATGGGATGSQGSLIDVTATRRRPPLRVQVLSNRADLVSAGDVLVAVALPPGTPAHRVRVTAGRRDVTRAFAVRRDGRFVGLVTGLRLGRTTLRATAPGVRPGEAVVTNHRNGGPVFSGPQTRHYRCQETARDALCNEPARYSFLYRSTDPLVTDLQPYDPADPPSDVATTTTDQGVEVPFVVRREDGFQDRDRYTILTLFRPGRRWTAWAPQRQWNRKLLVTHGGGCGASYSPGNPPLQDYSGTLESVPGVEPSYVTALGRGFAVLSTALDNTGHNCNVAMQAESLMMAKERLVERYGELRYTIGTGCSGGSIAQHTVANAYPGIYQGLITTCSYPDTLTAGAQFADYHLLRRYFEDPSRWAPGVVWSPTQMAAVEGHLTHVNAVVADEGLFKAALDPEHDCGGTLAPVAGDPSTRYDSEVNPGGVRCSVLDIMLNLLGPRPASAWGPQEEAVGRGFAGVPFANDGVVFGLEAAEQGLITTEQLVDLNEQVGGLDVDRVPTPGRTQGDPASIVRAYRTGLVNLANHLDEVAILNHGGPDPGIAHDYAHAFWTEDRLQADQGHTDNRVMWFGPTPLIGDPRWAGEALLAVDRWLTAVEADRSSRPLAAKVVAGRPADVTDRCLGVAGLAQVPGPDGEPLCRSSSTDLLTTRLSTPREVAGGPRANEVLACRLVPLEASLLDGLPLPPTEAQLDRLRSALPRGVCDWSAPGRGEQPARTWLRYDAVGGGAAYGGRELPPAPPRSGGGWASPAFAPLLRQ